MKFTPLVYILIVAIVLPPPQVFAAAPPAPKTYVDRLNVLIAEATSRERELAALIQQGAHCGPTSWVKECGGSSPQKEVNALAAYLKKFKVNLGNSMDEAKVLDAKISTDKIDATTACKGGAIGLSKDQEGRKAAGDKIKTVLADASKHIGELRKKFNTRSAKFIQMVQACAGGAPESKLPQFPGEGMLMLYKPIFMSDETCESHASIAGKFYVDEDMRRSQDSWVQKLYVQGGPGPSGLQSLETTLGTTLNNLETMLATLETSAKQHAASDKSDCSSLTGQAPEGGKAADGKPAGKSDVSGTDKKPEATKPAAAKVAAAEAAPSSGNTEAAAAAEASAGGKLKSDKNVPEIKNGTPGVGANAAKDVLASTQNPDGSVNVESPEDAKAPLRRNDAFVQNEIATGRENAPFAEADRKSDAEFAAQESEKLKVSEAQSAMPPMGTGAGRAGLAADGQDGLSRSPNGDPNAVALEGSSATDYSKRVPSSQAQASPDTGTRTEETATPGTTGPAPSARTAEAETAPNPRPRNDTPADQAERQAGADQAARDNRIREEVRRQSEDDIKRLQEENARLAGNQKETPGATTGGADQRPPASTESGGISATGALVGVAALGAIGGGIYMATKGKKKSSGSGALLPPTAPAASATQTSVATETAVSTATATSTATSTNTNTQAGGGVVIDLGPLSGQSPATQTLTSTSVSTATATSGENYGRDGAGGIGGVNKGNRNATGAATFRPAAPKKKLNSTGASMFRPSAP
jgi:hypothetical protein